MKRRTLDLLLSAGGLVVAVVLVVAGCLLLWANGFVSGQVHKELSAQKIFFPPKGSQAITSLPKSDQNAMNKYAGKQLTTGAQAKAYADHFIAVHLKEAGGGQTYAQLSAKAQANPTDTKLAQTVQTMFRGETLRGLLLNAYAFDTMANIAFIGAIAAFIGAAAMAVLAGLGFWHARRAEPSPAANVPAPEPALT
jgi:spore germination protein GerM